ncbi:carbon-nitrogen hydrolase family protein [Luedemannella helvata]|uniref:Carbon-nitrogen hydrolase family protein n=1 Tax=Luedemannella helvata TaxID=349315 RepID=A0ABP4W7H6_9ACTN
MSGQRRLRIAITQWQVNGDLSANVEVARELIDRAAADRPDLVLLPENGLFLGTNATMRENALSEDAPQIDALREAAARNNVTVILGGMKNRTPDGVFNSALVIDPRGAIAGRYDKVHLFDARIGGVSFEASTVERGGTEPVLVEINGVQVGLTICYDVRFPELYRALALAGAEVILVPSAFTRITGDAHWHTLLRARAIENGCFVVASATVGEGAFPTYGHALAVAPWGEVIADLGEEDRAVRVLELDLAAVAEARGRLPVLAGTKPQVYASAVRRVAVNTTEEATL